MTAVVVDLNPLPETKIFEDVFYRELYCIMNMVKNLCAANGGVEAPSIFHVLADC